MKLNFKEIRIALKQMMLLSRTDLNSSSGFGSPRLETKTRILLNLLVVCTRVSVSRNRGDRDGIRATAAKFDSFNEEPKLALRRLVRRQLDIGHSGERQRRCDKNMHNYAQRGRHRFVNNRRPFPLCPVSRFLSLRRSCTGSGQSRNWPRSPYDRFMARGFLSLSFSRTYRGNLYKLYISDTFVTN